MSCRLLGTLVRARGEDLEKAKGRQYHRGGVFHAGPKEIPTAVAFVCDGLVVVPVPFREFFVECFFQLWFLVSCTDKRAQLGGGRGREAFLSSFFWSCRRMEIALGRMRDP